MLAAGLTACGGGEELQADATPAPDPLRAVCQDQRRHIEQLGDTTIDCDCFVATASESLTGEQLAIIADANPDDVVREMLEDIGFACEVPAT